MQLHPPLWRIVKRRHGLAAAALTKAAKQSVLERRKAALVERQIRKRTLSKVGSERAVDVLHAGRCGRSHQRCSAMPLVAAPCQELGRRSVGAARKEAECIWALCF